MAVTIKSEKEIEILRQGGHRLAGILKEVVEAVKPGISAFALDRLAESLILKCGGTPSFKGHKSKKGIPYPASICVSLNDEIVHAIPNKNKILKDGDVVSLDIGMAWPTNVILSSKLQAPSSLYTDMAVTLGVGKISQDAERLIRGTKEALDVGIKAIKPNIKIGDVGYVVQRHLESRGLGVIRTLAGHGVGYEVHEDPLVPNFGEPGMGLKIRPGMVLAIEPMATLGEVGIVLEKDGWTFRTQDGSLSAHFEHTMAVTKSGVEVLTQ